MKVGWDCLRLYFFLYFSFCFLLSSLFSFPFVETLWGGRLQGAGGPYDGHRSSARFFSWRPASQELYRFDLHSSVCPYGRSIRVLL